LNKTKQLVVNSLQSDMADLKKPINKTLTPSTRDDSSMKTCGGYHGVQFIGSGALCMIIDSRDLLSTRNLLSNMLIIETSLIKFTAK